MIHDYYQEAFRAIRADIDSLKEGLLSSDTQSLVEHYVSAYELPPIKRDQAREPAFEEDGSKHLGQASLKTITYLYPIVPDEKIGEVIRRQASTSLIPGIEIAVRGSDLSTTIRIEQWSSPETVKEQIRKFDETIQLKNNDVVNENRIFRALIKSYVEKRKQIIATETEFVEKLIEKVGIPLKKRQLESPLTLEVKKRVIPPIRKHSVTMEPVLDGTQVVEIVKVIQNAGSWMVRTPEVFSVLQEEPLRDVLLAGLNMVFEGGATSETFSKRGHTDICLVISKGDILICECKIWDGPDYYRQGINQLFDYLTWRENYGVMITFSKKMNFSEIVQKATDVAVAHPSFIQGSARKISDTYFTTNHRFPTDSNKTVEIHHLLLTLV